MDDADSHQKGQFEIIARNEYTRTDEKNPIDCSLYYIALRKKNVLLGLWRMAAWNREQAGTQRLLKNDFSQSRWKTAALKNAYALLGKRRFGETNLVLPNYSLTWYRVRSSLVSTCRQPPRCCQCMHSSTSRPTTCDSHRSRVRR